MAELDPWKSLDEHIERRERLRFGADELCRPSGDDNNVRRYCNNGIAVQITIRADPMLR